MRRLVTWIVGLIAASAITACSRTDSQAVNAALDAAVDAARQGDVARALTLVDERLAHTTSDSNSVTDWRLRLLRADLLLLRRDVNGVAEILDVPLPSAPGFEGLKVRQQYLRARLAVERNDADGAMATAAAAREVAKSDPETQADLDVLIGRIHLQRGEWDQAQRVLTQVLSPSGDRYRQLQALTNLGFSRLRSARYDEALTWLERALAISEFEATQVYATALANAGICYSRLGLFERAINVQRRAVEIQRAQGGTTALVQALGSLGVTHGLQNDHGGALPFLEQAYQTARDAGLKNEAALLAGNMAAAYAHTGEWDKAEAANRQSLELAGPASRNALYNTLNAADIAAGRGQLDLATQLYRDALAAADVPSAQWSAHAGLAAINLRHNDGAGAAREFETALAVLERTRSDLLRTDYKLSFLTQLIEFYQSYVDALVDQGRSDRALEIADSSRGRVLAERQRVTAPARTNVAAFQRIAARSKTTLLAYWLAPKRSFLWVVSGSGVRRIDLPPAADIEKAVGEYRALIDNSLADPLKASSTPGDRLYQMLIAPARLPREASVVIVPDGALYGINFETLPVDGPQRHYWIADAQVQVAPSLAMLEANTTRPVSDGRLLLIGNPTPRAPEFPALSYAPAEMTSIVRHFPQDRVVAYDSARATPAVYQQAALDQFSMIHFTAHATANVESPLDSAVVLSGPDTAYKLYARDVADKPLKADLVTVSACRSAGERTYSGEGLVGFAWAFLRAGAHRVVAGLWDVDDRSTAQLMDALYSGVQAGQSPAASLRAAKLTLLANGGQLARPYYWGPFQMFTVTP